MDGELVTLEEAAGQIEVGPSVMRSLIRTGELAAVQVAPGEWRVGIEELIRYARRRSGLGPSRAPEPPERGYYRRSA